MRSRRKSQLGYFLFGSVARLPGIQNGHKQLGMDRTTTSSLVPFQPFQPGRNKLRHAPDCCQMDYYHYRNIVTWWVSRIKNGVKTCRVMHGFGAHRDISSLWRPVVLPLLLILLLPHVGPTAAETITPVRSGWFLQSINPMSTHRQP